MLTRIKGLYSILDAIAQTWQMIRNATRLTLACVVLGLVNQACAVTNGPRATATVEVATARTQVQPAPQWPQKVEVAMPLSAAVAAAAPLSVAESSRAELLAWRNSAPPKPAKSIQIAANSIGTLPPYASAPVSTPDAVPQPQSTAPQAPAAVAEAPAVEAPAPVVEAPKVEAPAAAVDTPAVAAPAPIHAQG